MKKFFSDFKKFISRGNIIDMAIGVVVGNAFSAIVKAFTDKIIMPLINFLLTGGKGGDDGVISAYTFLKKVETDGVVDLENSIYIDWGSFITSILNFLIIAFTLFIVLKVAMKSNEMFNDAKKKYEKELKITRADRKELKKRGINPLDLDAVREYKKEVNQKLDEEKAKKEAEEKARQEAERLAHPTQEDLLKEIRDLLKSKTDLAVDSKVEENK